MTKHATDRFSVSVGPSPSGEGEMFQLRRSDMKDPMLTSDTFTLDMSEMGTLLGFCIEHPDLQKWIIGTLSSKNLILPNVIL
jgi:hypothetical protein